MQRIGTIVIAGLLLFGFAACGDSNDNVDDAVDSAREKAEDVAGTVTARAAAEAMRPRSKPRIWTRTKPCATSRCSRSPWPTFPAILRCPGSTMPTATARTTTARCRSSSATRPRASPCRTTATSPCPPIPADHAMLRIGTSGWQYRDWRGRFYPNRFRPRVGWSTTPARFATVEVNNTFYRLPAPATFASWNRACTRDFEIAVKASRYLTHYKRLRDPEEPVERLMTHARRWVRISGPCCCSSRPTSRSSWRASIERCARSVRVCVSPSSRVTRPGSCAELRDVLARTRIRVVPRGPRIAPDHPAVADRGLGLRAAARRFRVTSSVLRDPRARVVGDAHRASSGPTPSTDTCTSTTTPSAAQCVTRSCSRGHAARAGIAGDARARARGSARRSGRTSRTTSSGALSVR